MLGKSERDMVIMQHILPLENQMANWRNQIESADFGDSNYTSIAKTVALPAAIGVKMILDGKIDITGVHISYKKGNLRTDSR